jgi:hypothetical protein
MLERAPVGRLASMCTRCRHVSHSGHKSTREAVSPRLAAATTTLGHIRPSASQRSVPTRDLSVFTGQGFPGTSANNPEHPRNGAGWGAEIADFLQPPPTSLDGLFVPNESTWTFGVFGDVVCERKLQVTGLR